MKDPAGILAVIFDMDGVLTDSEPLIRAAAMRMFLEKGLRVLPEDFLPFVGTGENRYIGGVAESYGFPLEILAAKRRTYEIYLDLVSLELRPFPGAVELVLSCRAARLKTAVASSADLIKIKANLEAIGIPVEGWDAVVSAEDISRTKPAPDIFFAAAAKLEVAPDHCVVVEDSVHGVEAALAAGMRCVAVAQTFAAARLRAAHRVQPGIGDVTLTDLLG